MASQETAAMDRMVGKMIHRMRDADGVSVVFTRNDLLMLAREAAAEVAALPIATVKKRRLSAADKAMAELEALNDELGDHPRPLTELLRTAGYQPFAEVEVEVGTGELHEAMMLYPGDDPRWMVVHFEVARNGQLAFQSTHQRTKCCGVEPLLADGGELWLRGRRS